MSQHTARMTHSERAAYALGRESFGRGEDATALEAFQTLLRTREGFADVYYMLGVLQDRGGDLEAAVFEAHAPHIDSGLPRSLRGGRLSSTWRTRRCCSALAGRGGTYEPAG